MHGGGNRIYGLRVIIHNGLFAECKVLDNFRILCVQGEGQGQGLVNWSSRIFENKDFPRGQQQCCWTDDKNNQCHDYAYIWHKQIHAGGISSFTCL